jgi:hypothetical protein
MHAPKPNHVGIKKKGDWMLERVCVVTNTGFKALAG